MGDLEPIAIIGLACRFPGGANSPEELWNMLAEGRSGWSEIPADRYTWKSFHHPHPEAEAGHNQRGGGYIDRDLAAFDAAFFNIPAAEANGLDPQQRIQLETAYEALESAGLPIDSVRGSKTSVHVATVSRDYDRNAYRDPQDLAKYHLTGCGEAITSGRVSYTFDLRGPCFSLDTGCSGSLVGLHLAVQGLRSRETDMALVGGTNLLLSPDMTIAMSKLHMLNDDGKCYAFDSRGNGYARSEGVSTIVLKRLSDAIKSGDPIRAVVRNTGINQDGKTNGIMLPNSEAQEDLMRSIHVEAGLDPSLTTYVEAHGTGTQAGDKAEINSISNVFCTGVERSGPLLVGSIKGNFGHTESASGLAGLIKTVLALEKGSIPPTPDVMDIKEGLDLKGRNIRLPQRLESWPTAGVRRAAINSFGYGGTNVAAILDSYHNPVKELNDANGTGDHKINGTNEDRIDDGDIGTLFIISAKGPKSLAGNIENLQRWVKNREDLTDFTLRELAYTLARRRSKFPFRSSIIASTAEAFVAAASNSLNRKPARAIVKPNLTFIFTGQGAQWYAMGRELFGTQSSFYRSIQQSEYVLKEIGATWSLLEELKRSEENSRINESEISQPATTALQIALVDLMHSFSIKPSSVVGHSSGEIAAAYAIGALSHESALKASYHRSKVYQLVNQVRSTPGGMLVTSLNESKVEEYIEKVGKGRLSLACINSPGSTTISGDRDAIEELKVILEGESILAKILAVDVAYHSHHMKAVADQYLQSLGGLEASIPDGSVQFFSSVTGELKTSGFGADYWVQNLVSTVRFSSALLSSCKINASSNTGAKNAPRIMLEIGPHSALAGPSKQMLSSQEEGIDHIYVSALVRGKNGYGTVLSLGGKLFELGVDVDIEAINSMNGCAKPRKMILDLPPYAWDYSNKYWHESRLSKEYRFRKYPYHDLLGLGLIGSTPLEPIWRNILSVDAQPWLSEHIIDGFAILPGSSFLTMAMEASRQLNEDRGGRKIKRFHMKNVNYSKAIMIPDSPSKVEVMISLSTSVCDGSKLRELSGWESFKVTSSQDTKTWSLNCQGYIRLEYHVTPNEVDAGREEKRALLDLHKRLSQIDSACTQKIDHDSLYGEMRKNGVDYGNNFATIKEIRIGDCQALGRVVIPDVAQCMPSGYQQPHTIHPATFDALMHIILPLYFRHCTQGTAMLTSIEEVSVAADMTSTAGSQLDVCAALSPSGPRSGSVNVSAFEKSGDGPNPVVILRGQKFQGTANSASSSQTATHIPSPFHTIHRPVKMAVATPGVISSLCFIDDEASKAPLQPDEVEIKGLAYGLDKTDVDVLLGRSGDVSIIGECAGVITALGSDLKTTFEIGDRVACWNTNVAFASQTRVKGSFVQKVPTSWSIEVAAALPQNLSLAYYALHDHAQVQPGQTVLVHGAGGSLGQAVALVANLLGAHVIATVNTAAERQSLELFRGTKPAHILYSNDIALPSALARLTEGAGVDIVFNTSAAFLSEELTTHVAPFGTIINTDDHNSAPRIIGRAIQHVYFSAAQLLRYRPSAASKAFKTALSLIPKGELHDFFPVAALSISNAIAAFKAVQSRTNPAKMVLLADEDAIVNVKQNIAPTTSLPDVERIIQAIIDLSIPEDQKTSLIELIQRPSAAQDASGEATNRVSLTGSQIKMTPERRLRAVSSISEAHGIILEELIKKISSLVTISSDQLDIHEPLVELGLDSLIATDFKDWLRRGLGADLRGNDILDSPGLDALATVVTEQSYFVTEGLPDKSNESDSDAVVTPTSPTSKDVENGSTPSNSISPTTDNSSISGIGKPNGAEKTNDCPISMNSASTNGNSNGPDISTSRATREYRLVPNKLPNFPVPDLDSLCDAFITGVKAFATPEELKNTIRALEEFKRPGSAGHILYDRAVARAADPNTGNWEHELQLHRGFLDRREKLNPFISFWFSHPLSKRQHSQAERAALLTYTANNLRVRWEAGIVKPVKLNEQELTTAYHPWIFNAVRIPQVGSDRMERHPSNDYCIVMYKGHAFKMPLFVGDRPATYEELLSVFERLLTQNVERSYLTIFTSDNRHRWAESRQKLQEIDPQNAATIATIEAAAFVVALDDASPMTASERARQFHFGGDHDTANRWHDKSIQLVVCTNGASATLGEHTMMDALTLDELNENIASAISGHVGTYDRAALNTSAITVEHLPLKTDDALEAHIEAMRVEYAHTIKDAEHVYLNYEAYGSKFLRLQKLSPKSVFQMVVQLAALATFGFTPPCWETVNQAHYHLGRVDIIQVISPPVATFLASARDESIDLSQRRSLLVDAIRAHVTSINKAGRNQGWERNFTALRALWKEGDEMPSLYEDTVYQRVRPRLMMSNCFETGMLEKGCIWKDPKSVWAHYEVYEDSVYFSIVASELGRATLFSENLKEAAELVKQIVLA